MRHRDIAGLTALAASLAIAVPTAQSQRLATTDLLARGAAAYDRLPERVTLRDAPAFSEALGYLFAYQQRALREGDSRVDSGAETALGWLLTNMAGMKAGKADKARSDAELRDRGMLMFDKARKSEQNGKIWDVPAFLSSSANLFAYLQVARDPEPRASEAHQWLVDAQSRLVAAGVAADGYVNPDGWLPRGRRPGTKPSGAGSRAGAVATRAGAGARARIAATDVVGSRAPRDTVRQPTPASSDSTQPAREPSNKAALDSTAKLYSQGRLQEARDVARSMLDANRRDGDAHMALAMIYMRASGKGSTPEDGAVRWLAIDHLTIAVKTRAVAYDVGRQMLENLEARIPTANDLAARGWIPGQRLRVSFAPYAWIDEETTIRARKE